VFQAGISAKYLMTTTASKPIRRPIVRSKQPCGKGRCCYERTRMALAARLFFSTMPAFPKVAVEFNEGEE
jgi:hypothetical protein